MDPAGPLTDSLSALSRFFVGDGTLQETLARVNELARDAIVEADMTGLTMVVEGRAKTAVFTDENAPEIDASQYETGIGPCLDAFRHQQIFRIDDTEKDERWPSFSEAAAARGVRTVLAIPLVANHEGVGALNFYSFTANAFSERDVEVASRFAAQASIVLANAQAYWDAFQLSQDLGEAMKSRAVIEQAKGILMGAQHCDADQAFQILVRASQRENRKLREIAAQLVANASQAKARPNT